MFDVHPVLTARKNLGVVTVNHNKMDIFDIRLHYNEVHLLDNIFWKLDSPSHFIDTSLYLSANANPTAGRAQLTETVDILINTKITVSVSPIKYVNYRAVYSIFDLLGDYGGLQEMIFLILGFFVSPIAEHSFLLKAMRKLYKVHTDDETIFENPKSEKHSLKKFKHGVLAATLSQEKKMKISRNKKPKVSAWNSFRLFWQRLVCCCCTQECRGGKLTKLLDIGGERLETEFDVVKIVRQLRNLKELMSEKKIWDNSLKFAIKHTGMNVIELDSVEDSNKYTENE